MLKKIFESEFLNMGISATPFNAWLMLRGLRTLDIRLSRVAETTQKVVSFLKSHDKVEEVVFPFDPDFSQFELAKKQMQGAGGLFSFSLKTKSLHDIEQFCEGLEHIIMAVSWGGYESLIIPACASINENDFNPAEIDQRRMRMYVGLEDADYIIEDLERSFSRIKNY